VATAEAVESAEGLGGEEATAPVEVTTPASAGGWTDGLAEDAQGYIENKGWDGPDQMLDSYRNLEKSIGVPADKLLHMPKDAEDAEGWNNVYNRLGRPETAEDYQLSGAEVPEGAIDLTGNLKEWAHEAGLSQQQTAMIYDKYNGRVGELAAEQQQQADEVAQNEEAQLRKEWGPAWEENIAAAQRFRQRFGVDTETIDKLEQALGLRGVLELTAQIGRGLGEHASPQSQGEDSGDGLPFGMTPGAAKAKIGDLMLDKEFMSQYSEGNKQAGERMTRLHAIAYPDPE
tara:strand:+ start:5042 stop:5902 length:861 start_codon:yes stop_codon:yes gene_type:complete